MAGDASTSDKIRTPHISEQPFTWRKWHQHVNWVNTFFVLGLPLLGFSATPWVRLNPYTAVFALFYYFNTALGITAGYHRLWSHTSYRATLPLQVYLAAVGAGAAQGSIFWWSSKHRCHHRYTDTDKDPYSVSKGLLYSHIGWMVFKQNPARAAKADVADLRGNGIVTWQHRHYMISVFIMALVFPALVCGLWGDMLGGFLYAGLLRAFFLQQATYCINSLAHYLGEQPFDDRQSPRDNWITALITLGEGYHNYHHEFPSDYRNALEWYQWDPTKWMIFVWKKIGLAYNLNRFRQNEVEKGRLMQLQKKLDKRRARLDWGTPLDQLPVFTWDEYLESAQKDGRALVSIAGVIHDVASFVGHHPGGEKLLMSAVGKDATATFNGGVYNHSNNAHNMLATMRVGVLLGGCEVEIWKKKWAETRKVGDMVTLIEQTLSS